MERESSMQGSEIAKLKQQIEDECQSLYLLFNGYATVSSHDMIHHKYEAIDQHTKQLAVHIGEEEATNVMCETYNKVMH